jgi:hypothetical protein
LLSFILFYFLSWFLIGRLLWRYLLPVLPAGLALISYWCVELMPRPAKVAAGGLVLLNLVPFFGWSVNNNLFAVFGLGSVEKKDTPPARRYLEKTLDNYSVYDYANGQNAPMKILLFREMRGFYLDKPYIFGDPLNQSLILYHDMANSGELKARLAELGVTHIIVNNNLYPPDSLYYDDRVLSLMNGLIAKNSIEEFADKGVYLYKIIYEK